MNSPFNGNFYESQKYTHGKHDGLDLVGITHKEIHCVESGTVIYAGWENANNHSQGFGQYVAVKVSRGSYYDVWYYGHLSEIKTKIGASVKIGDIIGIEGTTGYSTGNHLHICIRKNGVKGADYDVSSILGIPNIETGINNPYNDGYEPVNQTSDLTSLSDDEFVRLIQKFLNEKHNAGLDVDGICGTKTRSAVKKYIGA